MNFPNREEYFDFIKFTTDKDYVNHTNITVYNKALKSFDSVEDLINSQADGVNIYSSLIVFLSLKYKLKVSDRMVSSISIRRSPEKVIRYFSDNSRFLALCKEKLEQGGWQNSFFYPLLLRAFLFLGKSNIDDIGYKDLKKLYCEPFLGCHVHTQPFIGFLASLLGEYTGRALPYDFRVYIKEKDEYELYGTHHIEIQEILNKYLKEEYTSKGIPTTHPLKGLKTFATWLYEKRPEITNISSLKREDWLKFQEFVFEAYEKNSTRGHKLHTILKLLKWLQHKNYLANVVGFRERAKISNSDIKATTESRNFESREQFNILLAKILTIKPTNEKEELIKQLFLVASATGVRLSEVLWLGPGCLTLTDGDVGEIILQVREKQGLKNKPMSVLPWGVEAINFLEERYKKNNEGKTPLTYYHEQTAEYFPSLFELKGKVISVNTANVELNKLIDEIEAGYVDETVKFKKGSKFHGFRHQKLNDILDVTGGSVSQAKLDSYHQSSEMLLRYSKQGQEKRQEEAHKALDEGRIVGKYADVLKQLLLTPYSPEDYLEVVKKLNLSSFVSKEGVKKAMKYLGFGYCGADKCKVAPTCEGCDYFWTCNTFSDELAERYAINFALIKSRQNEIMSSDTRDLITSLKYQEKWLLELGFDESSIQKLRTQFVEEGSNND
ncbi:MAG: hypothetical protein H6Q72_2718 [Firmicutes bacterium]|nr:hypothetical protein [Bacillota bacterium]